MTQSEVKVDALLQVTASRLLSAAEAITAVRHNFMRKNVAASVTSLLAFAQHLDVIVASMDAVHREFENPELQRAALYVIPPHEGMIQ